jgi:hypothetical protein
MSTSNNRRKNDEGLVQRLFDQLEKAMDKVDDGMSTLSIAIAEMLDILKHSTTNEDVIGKIIEHDKEVVPVKDLANKMFENCNTHGKGIDGLHVQLAKVSNWIKTMILTVTIAFSLLTISYLYTKSSINDLVKTEVSKSGETLDQNDNIELLIKKIDMLQKKVKEEIAKSDDHRKKENAEIAKSDDHRKKENAEIAKSDDHRKKENADRKGGEFNNE